MALVQTLVPDRICGESFEPLGLREFFSKAFKRRGDTEPETPCRRSRIGGGFVVWIKKILADETH